MVSVNDVAIGKWSVSTLERLYAEAKPGTTITVEIIRPSTVKRIRLEVRAGVAPRTGVSAKEKSER